MTRALLHALKAPAVDPPRGGRTRPTRRLESRERRTEALAAVTFLGVAVGMAAGFDGNRALDPGVAAMLIVAYALVRHVRFDIGAGFGVATLLVFVPMLFLLPADLIPLAVAAGSVVGVTVDILFRDVHPERAVVAVANSWFAVGPALVFTIGDFTDPVWTACVLAFAAQIATDLAASTTREWLCSAIPPRFQMKVIGLIAVVDALLWPIGLLAALAGRQDAVLALLVLPLAGLLALVAHDRTTRLEQVRSQTRRLERATHRMAESFGRGLDLEATLALAIEAAVDATDATTGRVRQVRDGMLDPLEVPARDADALLHDAEQAAIQSGRGVEPPTADRPTAMAIALRTSLEREDDAVVLSVARSERPFSASERQRFHDLARQAGVSVENVAHHERLARQATTDALTGLLNDRRLHEVLGEELGEPTRFRPSVGLVMLDIDDFKRVNDTYGHQRGDEVLRAVARAVESAAREGDHVARYGGEELAVVLPHTDLAEAHDVAERIRRRIEDVAVKIPDGSRIRPTASLGVAVSPGHADKDALIAAADRALYSAKRSGKNRSVCAPELARGRSSPV